MNADDYGYPPTPHVVVKFKSSTARGGGEGYEISVTSEATEPEVNEAFRLAALARRKVLDELRPVPQPRAP